MTSLLYALRISRCDSYDDAADLEAEQRGDETDAENRAEYLADCTDDFEEE